MLLGVILVVAKVMPAPTMLAPTALWARIGPKERPWRPHPAQVEMLSVVKTPWPGVMQDGKPYPSIISINAGRQVGKTEAGVALMWQGLLAPDDNVGPPQVRLTADTEEHAQKIWGRFIHSVENGVLGQALLESHSRDRHLVRLKNGATAQMLSGKNPQALSGDSVSLWVVDEAQFFSQAAYANMLPSILARNGVIVFLGVAQGNGPFKETSWRGEPDNRHLYPRYLTLRYSSFDNPFVKPEAVALMAETLTPDEYDQLILARWGKGLGKVFGDVRGLIDAAWPVSRHASGYEYTEPYRPGNLYYGGLDLARFRDWSVYEIYNSRGELVAWDRFHRMPWEKQYERILALHDVYRKPLTAIDATGLGIAPTENLRKRGMALRAVTIGGNAEKRRLVDQVALRVSDQGYRFPKWDQLINEVERYEATEMISPKGNTYVTYSAPSGFYDDTVMALALATEVLPRVSKGQSLRGAQTSVRQAGIWEDQD